MAKKQLVRRRKKALNSLMERRRQGRKRNHLRIVHRVKMFTPWLLANTQESNSAL